MSKRTERTLKFETLQLHVGQEEADQTTGARAVPIYQTTSYVFEDCAQGANQFALQEPGYIYSRLANPTTEVFEKRMAALEGGVAGVATASGAAAITYAIQNIARAKDHIVSANALYGGTYNLFAHTLADAGIQTTFVDPHNIEAFAAAIQPNTKAIYTEVLGNPNCTLVDIEALAELAHAHGIPLLVDSTFTPPYLFQPLAHGADIVVHSATKFIGGHGTSLGGIIIDGGTFDWLASDKFPTLSKPDPNYHGACFGELAGNSAYATRIRAVLLRDTGATLSPFHSFLFLQGLETLSLRLERQIANTEKIVRYLANHPKVACVHHPLLETSSDHELYTRYFPKGAGSIFTFEIKGNEKDAQTFIDHLEIFSLLANVADVKSLVIHPGSTTHSQLSEEEKQTQGILPTTIRLSIGCEHIDDLLYDLEEAFASVSIG